MTDKELLELAAKAVGKSKVIEKYGVWYADGYPFNPLTDDGDALRLAVKLNLSLDLFDSEILCGFTPNCNDCAQLAEKTGVDPYAATRRAIVRAAAEIGKEMK